MMTSPPVAEYRDSARRFSSPAPPPAGRRARRPRTWLDHIVLALSLLNLAGVLALAGLLCFLSEDWWLSLALSYLPRLPWLIPSLLLLLAAALLRRRTVWLNLFSTLLVLGPVMGFRAPVSAWAAAGDGPALTVVSYNVQARGSDFRQILAQLDAIDADVIVLQEATINLQPLVDRLDKGWHYVRAGEYLIAARWPVSPREACRPRGFGRATAILCEVDHPDGAFLVADVHLTTARFGLTHIRPGSPFTGEGVAALLEHQRSRVLEVADTRAFFDKLDADIPLLIVGDFNMPVSSSLYQQHWGDLTSAFDAAGWGYGYTAPCSTNGNYWPDNWPWLRIDHILLSKHWDARSCRVGASDGSDHRCITARVARR